MLQVSVCQHQGQPSTHHQDSPRETRRSSPQLHHCQKCTPVLLLGFPSECDVQLTHQHHSGEPTPKNPKRFDSTHPMPHGLCQVYPSSYSVCPPVSWRRRSPIVKLDHYRFRKSWEKQVDLLPPRCLPRRVVPNDSEGSGKQIVWLKS
jgi:hypothetical protein